MEDVGEALIFVDSNMWLYYFGEDLPEHEFVKDSMKNLLLKEELVVNSIVVMEVAHHLIRVESPEGCKEDISLLLGLNNLQIIDFDYEILIIALDFLNKYAHLGLGGRDASILATMRKMTIQRIFTHDNAFKRIQAAGLDPPIEVSDPIPLNLK